MPIYESLSVQAIDRSEPATLPSKRIQNIIDYLTYEIYLYIQRGLFERHKLLFALMLTNKVLLSSGATRASDIDVFLKGGGALDIMSVRKKPKDWIPDNVWLNVIALSQMDSFRDIPDSVFRNDSLWKQWCASLNQVLKVVHRLDDMYSQVVFRQVRSRSARDGQGTRV